MNKELTKIIVNDTDSYRYAIKCLYDKYKDNKSLYDIIRRGAAIAENYKSNTDILWMGINPSYKPKESSYPSFDKLLFDGKGYYWKTVEKILNGIDCNKEHIDLFSVRETRQDFLRLIGKNNKDTIDFFALHLWYTQQFLENYLKPKVIILANKGAGAYLGLDDRYIWIGYNKGERIVIDGIPESIGSIYKINGFRKEEKIAPKDAVMKGLDGTIILHARFQGNGCPKKQQITTEHIEKLCKYAGIL